MRSARSETFQRMCHYYTVTFVDFVVIMMSVVMKDSENGSSKDCRWTGTRRNSQECRLHFVAAFETWGVVPSVITLHLTYAHRACVDTAIGWDK